MAITTDKEVVLTALRLLESEIDKRQEIIDKLRLAAKVLRNNAVGSYEETMTKQEVMKLLDVSHTSIRRYLDGMVPSWKPPFPRPCGRRGRELLFKTVEITQWTDAIVGKAASRKQA